MLLERLNCGKGEIIISRRAHVKLGDMTFEGSYTVEFATTQKANRPQNAMLPISIEENPPFELAERPLIIGGDMETSQKIAFYRHSRALQRFTDEIFGHHGRI